MAPHVIVHRTIRQPAWWLFGAGLALAAWWGLPLIESERLENQFFGLFWYSMLALGAASWAVTVEQRVSATTVERCYCLLGLFVLWRQSHPIGDFSPIGYPAGQNRHFGASVVKGATPTIVVER